MKNKIKNLNKKAQIGLTLTWFFAFIIIFFIMIIFVAGVSILSSQKIAEIKPAGITIKQNNVNEIQNNFEKTGINYDLDNIEFLNLLDTKVSYENEDYSMKQLIILADIEKDADKKSKLLETIEKSFKDYAENYYNSDKRLCLILFFDGTFIREGYFLSEYNRGILSWRHGVSFNNKQEFLNANVIKNNFIVEQINQKTFFSNNGETTDIIYYKGAGACSSNI